LQCRVDRKRRSTPTKECERAERKNGVGGDRFFWSPRVFNAGSIEKEDRPLQWNAGVPSEKNGVGGDRFFWSPRVFKTGSIEKEDRPLQWNASVPSEKMA